MTSMSETRATLRASLDQLRVQEIESAEHMLATRLKAFADANELVRVGGVDAEREAERHRDRGQVHHVPFLGHAKHRFIHEAVAVGRRGIRITE